jgi:hypothetical protein
MPNADELIPVPTRKGIDGDEIMRVEAHEAGPLPLTDEEAAEGVAVFETLLASLK